jgi:hypothetical protein
LRERRPPKPVEGRRRTAAISARIEIAVSPVSASIHEQRDEMRYALPEAVRQARPDRTHAVKPKRLTVPKTR